MIAGLPRNPEFLGSLAKELKKICGTRGKTSEDSVELQGDQRDRLREILSRTSRALSRQFFKARHSKRDRAGKQGRPRG